MLDGARFGNASRWGGLAIVCLGLNACASSIENINDAPDPVAQTVIAPSQAVAPVPDAAKPLPKDAKILVPGSRVNDYVNESLPSQFAHTLQELNKAPLDDQYPAIADTPESERRLLTLEERRKLEEELRKLNGS